MNMSKSVRWIITFSVACLFILLVGCAETENKTPDLRPIIVPQLENPTTIYADPKDTFVNTEPRGIERINKPDIKETLEDVLLIHPECEVLPGWDASFIVTYKGYKSRIWCNDTSPCFCLIWWIIIVNAYQSVISTEWVYY